jgi:hypothetical protein
MTIQRNILSTFVRFSLGHFMFDPLKNAEKNQIHWLNLKVVELPHVDNPYCDATWGLTVQIHGCAVYMASWESSSCTFRIQNHQKVNYFEILTRLNLYLVQTQTAWNNKNKWRYTFKQHTQ